MMNKIKNKIKDFLVNTFSVNLVLIIALILLIPKAYSKPIPPGSGEGDVPANILFLLDSSKSMKASITGGSYLGLEGVDWSVALSNGDIIIAEQGRGLVKVSVADNKLDDSFAKNKKILLVDQTIQIVHHLIKTHLLPIQEQGLFHLMVQFMLQPIRQKVK